MQNLVLGTPSEYKNHAIVVVVPPPEFHHDEFPATIVGLALGGPAVAGYQILNPQL